MKKVPVLSLSNVKFLSVLLCLLSASMTAVANDYTTYLTPARGFTEVTTTDDILSDADYYYILAPAETIGLIVGVGKYEKKPTWAGEDTKALRYKSAAYDPVLDLTNFFTIEKSGSYIGFRNVVYNTSLFQTQDNAGYMYVLTYTEPTMSDWCYLTPTYQDGYWLFENGKYPMSSNNWACGYMGPWNKKVVEGQPIALNRRNVTDDEAGHYRLFRIKRSDLETQRSAFMNNLHTASTSNPIDVTWLITNPSFETGDETGWTLNNKEDGNNEFKSRDYGMSNKDGQYLMNAYQWWATNLNVSQTADVPSGAYTLSGYMATWSGRTAYFSGNGVTTTIDGSGDGTGIPVSVDVTVDLAGKLTIRAGSTAQWWVEGHGGETQTFFKLDKVRLLCKGFNNLPLPNDESTPLRPNFWYYYDISYPSDYWLVGNIGDIRYTTSKTDVQANSASQSLSRSMTLRQGRIYFRTSSSNATLRIIPKRRLNESEAFTAVALNVDGLPKEINLVVKTIELNPDGPGSEGTKKISKYLAMKGYDFIGCSEDFNYHGSLISELQNDYSWGEERAPLSASGLSWEMIINGFRFDTDGLNLLWKNASVSASNETCTQWESMESTDGNQYVKKGFRHYDMTVGNQTFDVYILHMDAGDTNATNSRHSQWQQLAGAVNSTDATRPKLIIGDTNSRWTREDITTNFMNRLNSNLVASDVWVEFYRDGVYPTTDMNDLTDQSDPTNYTNFEIVDKIIYINPTAANTLQLVPQSFKIEQDYTYGTVGTIEDKKADDPLGDHRPVVVTFKCVTAGAELTPVLFLGDEIDNTRSIADFSNVRADVTLSGRTLHKDNAWNTICLPFDMTAEQVNSQLAPAGLMTFSGSSFESSTGTLTLNFADATTINAGIPYIIKWNNADNIINPVFTGVVINNTNPAVVGSDGAASFVGTYAPVNIYTTEKKNLYLGNDNKLYYPTSSDFNVNAFRAYFQLNNGLTAGEPNSHVKSFVLNFDGEEILTGIAPLLSPEGMNHSPLGETEGAPWYDLSGRKLSTRQIVNSSTLPKGIYINQGRKIVIK